MKQDNAVLKRLEALEKTPGTPPAAPGPSFPTRGELTKLETELSDTVAQVTILVADVEDLKVKLSPSSPTLSSLPTSSPPSAPESGPPADPVSAPPTPPAVASGLDPSAPPLANASP